MNAQQLNRTGCCALAARIITDCIGASRLNPALLDVALDWAVMCGYDPIEVAPELAKRAAEAHQAATDAGDEADETPPPVRERGYHNEYQRKMRYSRGRLCPHPGCGVRITNTARTCQRHSRWFKRGPPHKKETDK